MSLSLLLPKYVFFLVLSKRPFRTTGVHFVAAKSTRFWGPPNLFSGGHVKDVCSEFILRNIDSVPSSVWDIPPLGRTNEFLMRIDYCSVTSHSWRAQEIARDRWLVWKLPCAFGKHLALYLIGNDRPRCQPTTSYTNNTLPDWKMLKIRLIYRRKCFNGRTKPGARSEYSIQLATSSTQ